MSMDNPGFEEHHIDTEAVKPFLRSMAIVARRFEEREEAEKRLNSHLDEMQKRATGKKKPDTHVRKLREHIDHLVETERKLAGYKGENKEQTQALEEKITRLEGIITEQQQAFSMEKARYRKQIDEMKSTFAALKEKLLEMIDEKRKRDQRLATLHQHIRRSGSPPQEFTVG